MVYIEGNFESMAQKVISDKARKEKEESEKKKNIPFMQIDKSGDPISNFISNFRRQFMHTKGLGLGRLFGGKPAEQPKQTAEPDNIISATKTVMRSGFNNDAKSQDVKTNKKPTLKLDNSNNMQKNRPKNKLGL